ncbi:MAG TPA: DUF1634 domain-containing protein [Bacteroidia bacterium]|jgi:uncharacterized membrane protein|nr:DUF1634 domain-containing protein [Bacteroidia bacterium]
MSGRKWLKWGDPDMELLISRIMRYGIVLASIIVIIGCVTFLIKYGSAQPQYSKFVGQPEQFTSVSGIISSLNSMSGRGLIEFGLLVLIAIPVMRVAFSIVSFMVEKDRTYVIITCIVFALLLFSLFGQQ